MGLEKTAQGSAAAATEVKAEVSRNTEDTNIGFLNTAPALVKILEQIEFIIYVHILLINSKYVKTVMNFSHHVR
jgi:hypothetical protein